MSFQVGKIYSLACLAALILSLPSSLKAGLEVKVFPNNKFCLVVPKYPNTKIGDSEYSGGTTVWCRRNITSQGSTGHFNDGFWTRANLSYPKMGVVQITGCINPYACDRLNPHDDGGQYDSNGGQSGSGNPAGSFCSPYGSYVQLIEPSARRACIRCCTNPADCDTSHDTQGCKAAIPGDYYGCE
ncbi:hypothetical protein O181_101275 [Austropuccinia psidii MF-1]|uniref:Secreted protein n=1 Tax=Austropuccinia psidii MF-1 TaxID=1389203 RepID=A0A9Q3PHL3_9BASI|nr:hypothetical protein [Austropuccinia psidii MF-1]